MTQGVDGGVQREGCSLVRSASSGGQTPQILAETLNLSECLVSCWYNVLFLHHLLDDNCREQAL